MARVYYIGALLQGATMRTSRMITALALLLLLAQNALATGQLTGQGFRTSICKGYEQEGTKAEIWLPCLAYVMGAAHALQDMRLVCIPPSVGPTTQALDVVIKYMRDHPEVAHYSASSTIYTALKRAFPCK